jgi:hypothetical protein
MDEMTTLAAMIGVALLVIVAATAGLIRSGRVVPFPTAPAAWWAGRRQ